MRRRFEALWAIRPEAAATVVRLIARDSSINPDVQPSLGSGKAAIAGTQAWTAANPFTQGAGSRRVAVIPIQGVLTGNGPSYYGTNYQTIADAAEKAAADPDVTRIILSVDSPGGEVTGLPETAALLANIAKTKPVSAVVEGQAASAAYWLASQANDITLTPSGEVGSVGVRMMHVDMSKMLENEGYKVTELHSGDFKTEWSPYHELSDEAKADMQPRIEASHKAFMSAVAAGRGTRLPSAVLKGRIGEGRMFSSEDALKAGLVDKVQSSRDFYRGASRSVSPQRARLELERLRV